MILEFDLSKKMIQQNFEAKVYTDYTLAFEFVVAEKKSSQLGAIPKWFRNLSCKKKRFHEIWGQPVERILHFTFKSIYVERKLLEFDTFPKWFWNLTCQKKKLKKFEGDL